MTFTRTGPNSACSDNFEVKIAKRDQLHYVKTNETVIIPIEIGVDRVISIAISKVDISTHQDIKNSIDDALNFLEIPHRFDN
ncbi:MAG: hypothetical protein EOM20_06645 [Spartobacteria bacterium]|nr:hypothetical protein [Spartobacteria bacterium]